MCFINTYFELLPCVPKWLSNNLVKMKKIIFALTMSLPEEEEEESEQAEDEDKR